MRSRRIHKQLLAARQAEIARQVAVVDAVWARDESKCRICGNGLQRPGIARSPQTVGYVKFVDPKAITVETGRLLCGTHFHAAR